MYLPRGVAQPVEFIKRLNALAPFPRGVVNLRYTVENDWSGDPAVFFGLPWQMRQRIRRFFPKPPDAYQTSSPRRSTRPVNGASFHTSISEANPSRRSSRKRSSAD